MNELMTNEWYNLLVDDCKTIITEAVNISRWSLVAGYHALGKRIVTDGNYVKWAQNEAGRVLADLRKAIGVSESTLYRAIQFYKKYPVLNNVPEGKSVSWNKIITKYLPEHTQEKTEKTYQWVFDGIERWAGTVERIVEPSVYSEVAFHVMKIRDILNNLWGTGLSGYRGLMTAIIVQAKLDNDKEWLLGEDCEAYCEAVGYNHQLIKENYV